MKFIKHWELVHLFKRINIITRSPEQYTGIEDTEGALRVSVEENLEDRTIQDFQNCCVVFEDILDSNQRLIDPFFTRGRQNDLNVYYLSKLYYDLPERTIRNNSNKIVSFQQTLKDVEHIYRDIAGFDLSYDEFKFMQRCIKTKNNYLLIKRLEDKNSKNHRICNESDPEYKNSNRLKNWFFLVKAETQIKDLQANWKNL